MEETHNKWLKKLIQLFRMFLLDHWITVLCSSSPSVQETLSRSKFYACPLPLLSAPPSWKSKGDVPHKRWTCQCRFDAEVNGTFWQRLLEPWTSQKVCQLLARPSYTHTHLLVTAQNAQLRKKTAVSGSSQACHSFKFKTVGTFLWNSSGLC